MIMAYVEDRQSVISVGDSVHRNIGLINEVEPPELKYVEVPKVLGDVFESLIGAVYIDSGHDLNVVWNIFKRLFKNLDKVIANPPKNPKKELLEMFPEKVSFSFSKSANHDMMSSVASVKSGGGETLKFTGLGQNKTNAQTAACKLALKLLRKSFN